MPRASSVDYPIFDSIESVPSCLRENSDFVIEKFLPEREGAFYFVRQTYFLGDRYITWRIGCDRPIVRPETAEKEVEKLIGADWLVYQNLSDLIDSAREGNPHITSYECSVFDGKYVTGDVDEIYLKRLETTRNDSAKKQKKNSSLKKKGNELKKKKEKPKN